MKAGGAKFRPRKTGNVRAKRQKKSTPTARASVSVGGAKLKRSKTVKVQKAIQPAREGMMINGWSCSLAHNPKTGRYDMLVSGTLAYSSVSHAACLQAAEVLKVTWQ